MHLYNYIWVVILVLMLNLAFFSPKFSCGIDKVLVCLCPCGFDNPRNTLRWKLLQLASVHLWIILLGLRTANKAKDDCEERTWTWEVMKFWSRNCPVPDKSGKDRTIPVLEVTDKSSNDQTTPVLGSLETKSSELPNQGVTSNQNE
jgi:hypothetical protein